MGYKGLPSGRPPTKTQVEVLSRMASGMVLRSSDAGERESFWLIGLYGHALWINAKTFLGLKDRGLIAVEREDYPITRWMLTARGREALKKG